MMQEDTKRRIEELEKNLFDLNYEFQKYKDEKAKEESQRLRTALIWAGGLILAIVGFMWWEIIWPAIKGEKP